MHHLDEADRQFQFQKRVIPSGSDPLWIFLRVCKHWRTIILSTPQLWSTFHLELSIWRHGDVAHLLAFLDTLLQRSKSAPLTLTILLSFGTANPGFTGKNGEPNASIPVRALLQKVMECQNRRKDVVFGAAAAYRARGGALPLPVAYTIRLGDMKVLKRSVIHNRLGSTSPGEHCMELGPCPQLETMRVIGSMDIVDRSSGSDERLATRTDSNYIPKLRDI